MEENIPCRTIIHNQRNGIDIQHFNIHHITIWTNHNILLHVRVKDKQTNQADHQATKNATKIIQYTKKTEKQEGQYEIKD